MNLIPRFCHTDFQKRFGYDYDRVFGRLERRKGIDYLVPVLRDILTRYPRLRIRWIGKSQFREASNESYADWIRRELNEFRDRVDLAGSIPLDDLAAYYAETDLCIFPSLWENFPNVCLEAMAAGRAIIGSRFGGMREMLEDGQHGRIVDPYSAESMTRALDELITDPKLRQRLGQSARQRVLDAYSAQRIVPRMLEGYRRAIANAS